MSDETGFCPHCEKLWMSAFDSDGFVEVDELTMEETIEMYEPGKPGVLFNAPAMVHAEDIFSSKIQELKDKFKSSGNDLDRDWPDASFRDMASSVLLGSGILYEDADRARNPYKRTLGNQVSIGKYVSDMVSQWLEIRACVGFQELQLHVSELRAKAESVGKAARSVAQQQYDVPIFTGAISASDVMRSGFACASYFASGLADDTGSGEDREFTWGEHVAEVSDWAKSIGITPTPELKSVKRKKKSGNDANSSAAGEISPDIMF